MNPSTEPNLNERKKTHYISLLYVISAFSVVILHANGAFWAYRDAPSWRINNIIECIFYFAVPVFFMLSGATLLDYRDRYDTKTFLKKRFSKTLIPFFFWSFFALFLKIMQAEDPKAYFLDHFSFVKIFNGIFNTEYEDIFWFFIPLFCVYLSIPLLSAIPKEKKVPVYAYTVGVAGTLDIIIPFIIDIVNRFANTNIKWNFSIPVVGGYLIYVLIGYLLHRIEFNASHRIIIYVAGIIGLLTHIFGTQILSAQQGYIDSFFKGYLNLPCLLYSCAVFVSVKAISVQIKNPTSIKWITFLQSFTFAMYLMHKSVFRPLQFLLDKIHVSNQSILYVFLLSTFTILFCILIASLIRKIKYIRNIIP